MYWNKVISVLRQLLPIVGPQMIEAIRQRNARRQSPTASRAHQTEIDEEMLDIRRDLARMSSQMEKLAQHILTVQKKIRWAMWVSILSFILAVIAIVLQTRSS